jgi:hypothetical protein
MGINHLGAAGLIRPRLAGFEVTGDMIGIRRDSSGDSPEAYESYVAGLVL